MTSNPYRPAWTEKAPPAGTYRSIFKYGDPHSFKHPSDAWYNMIKKEFHLSDGDFSSKSREGLEPVSLQRPPNLASHQMNS